MIGRGCHEESATRAAAASGRWTDAARAHLRTCPRCEEVALITGALAGVPERPVVSDPGRLWVHGRVARRHRAQAQVSRLSLIVNVVIGLACAVVLVYAAVRIGIFSVVLPLELGLSLAAVTVGVTAVLFLLSRRADRIAR